MIAFVANTMFIAFVYARRTKNPVIRSYLLYTIILETWLFTHIFYWASPFETWTTWAFRILSITWLPVGLFYLEFVYIFSQNLNSRTQTTKSRSLLGSKTFSLEIFLWFFRIGIPILYLITLFTNWIIHGTAHYYWGNENEPSPLYYFVILIFITFPSFIGLGILTKSLLTSEGEQKKQISLVPIRFYIFNLSKSLLRSHSNRRSRKIVISTSNFDRYFSSILSDFYRDYKIRLFKNQRGRIGDRIVSRHS